MLFVLLQERIPLGRLAEPEDIVGPILFFTSRAADYCTGAGAEKQKQKTRCVRLQCVCCACAVVWHAGYGRGHSALLLTRSRLLHWFGA
jgi:hypothetical protein